MSIQERIEKVAVGQITATDFLLFYAEQSQSIQKAIIDEVESFKESIIYNYIKDVFKFKYSTDNPIKSERLYSFLGIIEAGCVRDFFNFKIDVHNSINDELFNDSIFNYVESNQSALFNKHIGKDIYFSIQIMDENSYEYIAKIDMDKDFSNDVDNNIFKNLIPHHFIKQGYNINEIDDPLYLINNLLTKLNDYNPEVTDQSISKEMESKSDKLENYTDEKKYLHKIFKGNKQKADIFFKMLDDNHINYANIGYVFHQLKSDKHIHDDTSHHDFKKALKKNNLISEDIEKMFVDRKYQFEKSYNPSSNIKDLYAEFIGIF